MPKAKRKAKQKKAERVDLDKRAYAWIFTINNWTSDDEKQVQAIPCKYLVYGREIGPEKGTPHLQGYIQFKTQRTFRSMCKKMPRASIRAAETSALVNKNYCTKQGDYFEQGVVPLSKAEQGALGKQAEQARWAKIKALAQQGDLDEVDPQVFVQCYRSLKQIKVDYMSRPPDLQAPCGIWLFGDSGAGKTTIARTEFGTQYFLKAPTKWWDSYQGEQVVILDDLDPYHKALGYHVKMWADKWSFVAEVKGSSLIIRPTTFIITSQYLPEAIWSDPQTVHAVRRRFKIIEVRPDKKRYLLTWPPNSPMCREPDRTEITQDHGSSQERQSLQQEEDSVPLSEHQQVEASSLQEEEDLQV